MRKEIQAICGGTGVTEHQAHVLWITASLAYMAALLQSDDTAPPPKKLAEMLATHCGQLVEELCREEIEKLDGTDIHASIVFGKITEITSALPFASMVFEQDLEAFRSRRRSKIKPITAEQREQARVAAAEVIARMTKTK